jgi:SAM-dependent methyltransferase
MKKKLLHVGCGFQTIQNLKGFTSDDWSEIRFDIDATVKPDLVGTLTDMSAVPSETFDAVYSSHNIEHLYPYEVLSALQEFKRVLTKDGFVLLVCPDLQSVCEAVANDKLLEPLYESGAGPISPIDILYGHRASLAKGNHYMAHKCGFTSRVLDGVFAQAGFETRVRLQRKKNFDLWMFAFKDPTNEEEAISLASKFFP